jgi:hypothetical protein
LRISFQPAFVFGIRSARGHVSKNMNGNGCGQVKKEKTTTIYGIDFAVAHKDIVVWGADKP